MDILIKGMEMPNKNMERCIILRFYPNGHICDENGRRYNTIPVPPHGRLIDADALAKNVTGAIYHSELRAAPTIIPAEESE